jgi:hypothetical protein
MYIVDVQYVKNIQTLNVTVEFLKKYIYSFKTKQNLSIGKFLFFNYISLPKVFRKLSFTY